MKKNIRIIMAQLNFTVGDIVENRRRIIDSSIKARDELQADMILFPELALTGYPPEDLLLRSDFHEQIKESLDVIKESVTGIDLLLGYPEKIGKRIYNAASVIRTGEIIATYHKQYLPNYGVFDEKRYFTRGTTPTIVELKGLPFGIMICEDIWFKKPIEHSAAAGAKLIISISASPFDVHKVPEREKILNARVSESNIPIIHLNTVGGQDEIVFDGRSIVINEKKEICHFAPIFKEELIPVDIEWDDQADSPPIIIPKQTIERISLEEKAYKALVTGLRDYLGKNGFPGVLIGLSGGMDSALTLAIAVDAIGKDRVHAVLMPSRFTQDISNKDAIELANNLDVKYSLISIEPTFKSLLKSLSDEFEETERDVTEENIQARIRGTILMALSNKFGKLVLTTGNKSEMAVGYATLYGDMAGGFALLKDLYKTLVYELANYRNKISPVIPQRIIDRPPSAELSHDQTDQDTLPPYPILDQILERYVEEDQGVAEITAAGFDEEMVRRIIKLVDRNEYKRRQAPPGVKITTRAFGRDRRYPITSGFGS